jgi:Zn-dependent protease
MAPRNGFSIVGIPVHIRPVFFLLIASLGLFYPWPWFPLTWIVIATVSVLVHELGHAVAFRLFGLRPSITLHGWGGLTSAEIGLPGTPRFTPWRSIVTSLAGPVAALVLFGLPAFLMAENQGYESWILQLAAGRSASTSEILLAQVIYINVGWSVLNLIPVLPLDGGNVTASMFELVAPRHGRRIANGTSIALCLALAWWGWVERQYVAPVFAAVFIGLNVAELVGARHDDVDEDLLSATRALVDVDPERADRLAAGALARGVSGERARWACELRAWSRLASGDLAGAHLLVVGMPAGGGPTASLRGALALATGRHDEGVATLAWAFVHDPDEHTKVLGAIAVAQAGQVDAVVDELLAGGPEGRAGAGLLRSLLEQSNHRDAAIRVAERLSAAAS